MSSNGEQNASVQRGTCHVCGEDVPVDEEHATERFGNVICRDCSKEPVAFRATCDNKFCDWTYRVEEREFNRGHAKTNAQMEANNHEKTKRIFEDDPMHNTSVEEVEP